MNEPTAIEELLDIISRLFALLCRLVASALLWLIYLLPALVAGFLLQFWMFFFPTVQSIFVARTAFPSDGLFGFIWLLMNGGIALLAIIFVGGVAFAVQHFWGKMVERLFARWIPPKTLSLV